TKAEPAVVDRPETWKVTETAEPEDEPQKTNTARSRRGQRGNITISPSTDKTVDVAAKPINPDVVEVLLDTASEDSSRDGRPQKDKDAAQPGTGATRTETADARPGAPSRFAQHLLSRTGDPNSRGSSISDADQARFVDRVARAVQATGDRGGTLRLRLSPPELGSLTLEVKVQGGAVSARVEADTPTARSLLLDNLPMLRERLAEQGLRVDQFDVDLADRHSDGTADGLPQNDQQQRERPRSNTTSQENDDTPVPSVMETLTSHGKDQLNIIV
ncbi:MAG: flagellar hook-length control protein FliK, partial [Pirellulaceae bacterium]